MSDNQRWVAAEFREALLRGDIPALKEAGLLDQEDINWLLSFKQSVPEAEETDRYEEELEKAVSKKVSQAVKNGNISVMAHGTGVNSQRVEATGYERLVNAIKPAAHQILIKGPKGSGKSTKAVDLVRQLHDEFDGDLKVMTNIKGPDEHEDVRFGETMSEFLEFAKEDGEKVIIGDEFSTVANEWTGGSDVKDQFGRAINALRKSEGGSTRLIIIGHEHDTDVAKILRVQSDVVIRADGKKREGMIDKLTIFESWNDYKNHQDWFRVRGMRDIPQDSPWSFDDKYFAHFEFDLDNPEKQIERGKLIDDWEKYQDEDSEDDTPDYKRIRCRGENKTGERCGSLTDHETGYCPVHREQGDGSIDPRRE